jgi:hypothetical protein
VHHTRSSSRAPPHPTSCPHPPRAVTAMACTVAGQRDHGRKGVIELPNLYKIKYGCPC